MWVWVCFSLWISGNMCLLKYFIFLWKCRKVDSIRLILVVFSVMMCLVICCGVLIRLVLKLLLYCIRFLKVDLV